MIEYLVLRTQEKERKVTRSNITSGKEILKKEIERNGDDVLVYLTITNKEKKIMEDIKIIDLLPSDVANLIILTPNNLSEKRDHLLIWEIPYLSKGTKRIFHYKMKSNSNKIPIALLDRYK